MELSLNHLLGLTFAFLGAMVINESSKIIWNLEQIPDHYGIEKHNKFYWCSGFGIIIGLIQLLASGFLIVKAEFMKFWCFVHAAIAALALILFIILAMRTTTKDRDHEFLLLLASFFPSMFLADFLVIIVVVLSLYFIRSKIPVPGAGALELEKSDECLI